MNSRQLPERIPGDRLLILGAFFISRPQSNSGRGEAIGLIGSAECHARPACGLVQVIPVRLVRNSSLRSGRVPGDVASSLNSAMATPGRLPIRAEARHHTENSGCPQGKINPPSGSLGPAKAMLGLSRSHPAVARSRKRTRRWPAPRAHRNRRNPPPSPRSLCAEDAAAGRLVVGQLCHRRLYPADRRRGTLRSDGPHGGPKVLDVAAGDGMASLAAARRWYDVTSTEYMAALLEHGRARAAAEGMTIGVMEVSNEL